VLPSLDALLQPAKAARFSCRLGLGEAQRELGETFVEASFTELPAERAGLRHLPAFCRKCDCQSVARVDNCSVSRRAGDALGACEAVRAVLLRPSLGFAVHVLRLFESPLFLSGLVEPLAEHPVLIGATGPAERAGVIVERAGD
jgi:hypothetical protein